MGKFFAMQALEKTRKAEGFCTPKNVTKSKVSGKFPTAA
jgi:hypothetical protein